MSKQSPADIETSAAGRPSNAWKWWLTFVLFMATVLTYLDRQTISLCGPKIRDEFHLSHERFGDLLASFRWAYGITHMPAGWMADRLPMRLTYGLAVVLWSAAVGPRRHGCEGFAARLHPRGAWRGRGF